MISVYYRKTCILFILVAYESYKHCINSRFNNCNLNLTVRTNLLSLSIDSMNIPDVKNVNDNMCLGLTLIRGPPVNSLMVCAFACVCGSHKTQKGNHAN